MDGTTCAMSSPLSDFSMFDYSTIVLYIYGDKRSDLQSTTSSILDQFVNVITSQTTSTYLNDFNDALAGAGILDLFNTISKQAGPQYNAPVLGTTIVGAESTDTVITLNGLSLANGNGIFYAIADGDSTGAPTRYQVRSMINNDDIQVSGGGAMYMGNPTSLVIPNLIPDTAYTVYYYGTSGDRTQYATVTNLNSLQIRTQFAGFVKASSRMEMSFTFIFALMGALIALMM